MTQHALIALIRNAETQLFVDPGGAVCFARNLVWGPLEFESWCSSRETVQAFDSDCSAGVVIDFDARAMLWFGAEGWIEHPRTLESLDQLIAQAWPGFEILYGEGMSDLQIAAGDSIRHASAQRLMIRDRQRAANDDAFDSYEPELESGFAWITILDKHNAIHQRWVSKITSDLIRHDQRAIKWLMNREAQDVPNERRVHEGMIIDEITNEIQVWGGRDLSLVAKELVAAWKPWHVTPILTGGYALQCKFSGPAGTPMSDAETLGDVLPALLMTQPFTGAMVIGQIGYSFRGCLGRVIAALTALVCAPFVIFAIVSGDWKSAGITISVIAGIVFVVFKWIERTVRQKFQSVVMQGDSTRANPTTVHFAGPQDPRERRQHLERLLRDAGLPSITQVKPWFPRWFQQIR